MTRGGTIHALGAADGASVWHRDAAEGLLGAGRDMVALLERDGTTWALDPATGAVRWKAASGVASDLAPVVDAERVIVAGNGVAVLDGQSGNPVWSLSGPPGVTSPPVVAGNCLLVAEGDVLRCRESGTGRSLWDYRARDVIRAPAIADDSGRIFVGSSGREFLALDRADGRRKWRWKVGADVRWPAVVAGDLVIFASHEDVLWGLARKGGSMVWRAGLPSRPLGPPLLVGDDVLVGCYGSRPDENFLVGFAARTGERLGDLRTPAELAAAPVIVRDRLVLALRDRRVIALQLPAGANGATSGVP
jgi:outer membrane protein assembly factor BamB